MLTFFVGFQWDADMAVTFKTKRDPLVPNIPTEEEWKDFPRIQSWRRNHLSVLKQLHADAYDDITAVWNDIDDIIANTPIDTLANATNNTNLNVTNTAHGLCPRLSGNASTYLSGAGTWTVPAGGNNAANHEPVTVNSSPSVNLVINANQLLSAVVIPGGFKLDDLGAPDDTNDLNANTSKHGLMRKLSNNATEYFDGSGNWSVPAGSGGNANHNPVTVVNSTTVNLTIAANQQLRADVISTGIRLDDLGSPENNTDLNASPSAHGLLPRLSNNANQYLTGTGTWANIPAANSPCEVSLNPLVVDVLAGSWSHGSNACQAQTYYFQAASNGAQIGVNSFMANGTYRWHFFGCRGPSAGIVRLSVNGVAKANIDLYSSTFEWNHRTSVGNISITGNASNIVMGTVGKNASSNGYVVYITDACLRRYA